MSKVTLAGNKDTNITFDEYIQLITHKCMFCGLDPRQKNNEQLYELNSMVYDKDLKYVTIADCYSVCKKCKHHMGKKKPAKFLEYLLLCGQHIKKYIPV